MGTGILGEQYPVGPGTRPAGQDVPAVIREMQPLYIEIYTNRTLVKVHVSPRVAFMGFVEGADDNWVRERGGRLLTNGLWYCP